MDVLVSMIYLKMLFYMGVFEKSVHFGIFNVVANEVIVHCFRDTHATAKGILEAIKPPIFHKFSRVFYTYCTKERR